jgi:hypothetical protein
MRSPTCCLALAAAGLYGRMVRRWRGRGGWANATWPSQLRMLHAAAS